MELEAERSLEHLFKQRPHIGLRLENVAVGDAHGDFQLDAVLVDDERDFARLDALQAVEGLLHQLADDAERRLAAPALLAAQSDLLHRVVVHEQHDQRAYRQQQIEHAERDDEPLDKLIVELALLDAAERRHHQDDDEHHSNDQPSGRQDLFDVLFHDASVQDVAVPPMPPKQRPRMPPKPLSP